MGDQIKKNEMVRACSVYGRGAYRVSMQMPGGKRSLGRPRHRWEHNITMDHRIDLAQHRDR
jgi:hypothetical protein